MGMDVSSSSSSSSCVKGLVVLSKLCTKKTCNIQSFVRTWGTCVLAFQNRVALKSSSFFLPPNSSIAVGTDRHRHLRPLPVCFQLPSMFGSRIRGWRFQLFVLIRMDRMMATRMTLRTRKSLWMIGNCCYRSGTSSSSSPYCCSRNVIGIPPDCWLHYLVDDGRQVLPLTMRSK